MDVMTASPTRHQVVSSDSDPLIRVNHADEPIGTLEKRACHDGAGVLHRAFSVFVLNAAGEVLLQQRHPSKRLWPGFWSNSCCSHPRAGEGMDEAVARRLEEELGVEAPVEFVYKFEYRAEFGDIGTEHELCWVYVGRTEATPVVNTAEIAAWKWIRPADLDVGLREDPESYTPWLKMEWERLRANSTI
ncbi:MAG: isopentenyl-diphosphate Delta-isomerase [Gammaproteobacteria bacterium]|nr:isopentenyl-diphosphate Delta-isomerase [Gammaproteobacteria bacterium]